MNKKNVLTSSLSLLFCLCIIFSITLFPAKNYGQNTTLEENKGTSSSTDENPSSLIIERAALATGIIDREPEGVANKFPWDIEKIYFFTQVQGALLNHTTITHRWYYKNKLMAEVELPVKSNNWRTYSSKRIIYEWIGNWYVEAVDVKGNVLKTLRFEIE